MLEGLFGKSKSKTVATNGILSNLLRAAEYEKEAQKCAAELEKFKLRPSTRLPVAYYYDGEVWVCMYCYGIEQYPPHIPEEFNMGAAPQGVGKTPEEAAINFDKMWLGRDK